MPAPIVEFVDVTVNVQGASAEKFSFGSLMGVFQFAGATRQFGPYFSQAEVVAAALGSAAAEAWAGIVFSQNDAGVDQVLIGREDALDADWTATMDAIELEDAESWYGHTIESRDDTDIGLVAAWTESRTKIYLPQTDSADLLAGNPGNIGETLKNAGYNRTALSYHATDGEYLDGAFASAGLGLNLDAPGGAGIWAYRNLVGVPFDDVTGAQALNIYNENANLFGRNKGLSFTSKGTMAAGAPRFIDVTTSLDWLKVRIEEEVLSTFVAASTKIPYTNAGINIIAAAVEAVLTRGVNFGHLSPDSPPRVIVPDISEVSTSDKQNRNLTLTVECVLAGAIQKATIIVNVTF